jgi:hypothetical protein
MIAGGIPGGDDPLRRNVALERMLARAGWTPENLGDRLNELAASIGLRVRGHRRNPRRWVYAEPGRAAPRVPREPWPALVCHVLYERLGERITLDALAGRIPGRCSTCPPTTAWINPGMPTELWPLSRR